MDLVQTKPKFAAQIAKSPFVVIPASVEVYRAVQSFLKHRPTSTGCFLITVDFKFTQTIRIDFVHSTDFVTGLVNFSAVLQENWLENCVYEALKLLLFPLTTERRTDSTKNIYIFLVHLPEDEIGVEPVTAGRGVVSVVDAEKKSSVDLLLGFPFII